MNRTDRDACAALALELFDKAHMVLTDEEKDGLEVADFGLGRVRDIGLQLIVYVNTLRVCAKEMALLPGQTCPEHRHVPTGGMPGKEETFRCRFGRVHLYVQGDETALPPECLPDTPVTVFHEIILNPGEQYTLSPGTRHWFRGGAQGAVVSEFSTHSTDETDVFTDERIRRLPVLTDESDQ